MKLPIAGNQRWKKLPVVLIVGILTPGVCNRLNYRHHSNITNNNLQSTGELAHVHVLGCGA